MVLSAARSPGCVRGREADRGTDWGGGSHGLDREGTLQRTAGVLQQELQTC